MLLRYTQTYDIIYTRGDIVVIKNLKKKIEQNETIKKYAKNIDVKEEICKIVYGIALVGTLGGVVSIADSTVLEDKRHTFDEFDKFTNQVVINEIEHGNWPGFEDYEVVHNNDGTVTIVIDEEKQKEKEEAEKKVREEKMNQALGARKSVEDSEYISNKLEGRSR